MSTTTAAPSSQLRCRHCGASLAPDQDWCLECGAAATTRILRPPSWKLAAGIVLGVVALVVVAVAIAVNGLSGDAHRAAGGGSARQPAATTAATTPATPAPTPSAGTAPASTPAAARSLAVWPSGRQAWTVVLATASSRAAAERRARQAIGRGVKAGVLDTSRFDVAANGAPFVVFTGQFPDQAAAVAAETRLGHDAPASVFVAQVSPR